MKVLTEQETRKKLLKLAKTVGCDHELKQIWKKYDYLLQKCTNEIEHKQMSIMGNVEIHKLFNFIDPLICDGVEILPAHPDYEKMKEEK